MPRHDSGGRLYTSIVMTSVCQFVGYCGLMVMRYGSFHGGALKTGLSLGHDAPSRLDLDPRGSDLEYPSASSFLLLIHAVDFPVFVQKLGSTVVEAYDLSELGTIPSFMFDNLAPDFDFSKQQQTIITGGIGIFFLGPNHIPE